MGGTGYGWMDINNKNEVQVGSSHYYFPNFASGNSLSLSLSPHDSSCKDSRRRDLGEETSRHLAGGRPRRLRLCSHPCRPFVCPNLRTRPRRRRSLCLDPQDLWQGHRPFSSTAAGEQRPEEESPPFAPETHLRSRRHREILRLCHLLGGIRRRRRNPSAASVRPRVPRRLHRHVARISFVVPVVPSDSGGRQVPEVRNLLRRSRDRGSIAATETR
ncbi:RING-H2 finger protein [Actinidia chinensis var. chinensis]|uniref:RING-H2 finger protein n=1 Tax=Actinidia chinensis var. chinensis TaxID=1590841 RepID=A0A2R6PZD9_ACTCC|nr:RING-H2 finger protein [Actinidia chinensis var. chinensis]